jgi:DNA-binding NarL/FixJ family response regulator
VTPPRSGSGSVESLPLPQPIRVGVVARKGASGALARSLRSEGLEVLGPVRSIESLDGEGAPAPDAVVVAASELGAALVQQVHALHERLPDARLVLVAPSANLQRLRVLLAEGVTAFVLESEVEQSLGLAVRSACSGLLSFPESLRGALVRPVLSAREKQVLGLVVLGLTNGEIARRLHLSQSTVKSHLSSSFSKLGARSRSDAAAMILDPNTGFGTGILTISES